MHQRESNDVSTLQSCRILPGHLVPTIAGPNLSLPSLFNLAAAPPSVASVLILASTVPRNSLPARSPALSSSSLLPFPYNLNNFPLPDSVGAAAFIYITHSAHSEEEEEM